MGQAIKLNGTVSDEWCIGDYVTCTYENACYDPKSGKMEADLLTIEESDWEPEPSESGGIYGADWAEAYRTGAYRVYGGGMGRNGGKVGLRVEWR